MKKLLNLVFLTLIFSLSLYATNGDETIKKVDTEKSKVEWVGKKVTGQHNGTVAIKSGELVFDGANMTGGSFVIDMSTITVDDLKGEWAGKLLNHLKSGDFFGTDNHGEAILTITEATPTSTGYDVSANLTIKDITAPVAFSANIKDGLASATIVIDRTVYGVRYGSGKFFDNLGDKTISDEFTLEVALAY